MGNMAQLHPDLGALASRRRLQPAAHRQPQPATFAEPVPAVLEPALENQELAPIRQIKIHFGIRRPEFNSHRFPKVVKQRHDRHPGTIGRRDRFHLVRVDHHLRAILGRKLPQLDKNDTALL